MKPIRVWDLPVRLFHWLLVLAIIGSFVTAKIGGNLMEWHARLGFFVLGLVTFRIVWGFVGNEHARFTSFVRGPSAVLAYARGLGRRSHGGETSTTLGHNPMGALSVVAILAVVGFQAIAGLFANDDILMQGPYADSVAKSVSEWFSKMHEWNSNLILVLIVVHLLAIGFYFFVKRENLVKPMITGEKTLPDALFKGIPPETARPVWLSWIVAIFVGALTYMLVARPFW